MVLVIAGTGGLYTKPCFSPRLYSLVLQVRAPESRERGAQHGASHFEDDWGVVTLTGRGSSHMGKSSHWSSAIISPTIILELRIL